MNDLKNRIKSRKTLEDAVLAIIYRANPSGGRQRKSNASLQKAFYKVKDKSCGLLDSLVFDCSTTPPYCDNLREALFRIEASRSLSTLNPSYRDYSLEGKSDLLQKSYEKFDEQERSIIDTLGEEMEEFFRRGEN